MAFARHLLKQRIVPLIMSFIKLKCKSCSIILPKDIKLVDLQKPIDRFIGALL